MRLGGCNDFVSIREGVDFLGFLLTFGFVVPFVGIAIDCSGGTMFRWLPDDAESMGNWYGRYGYTSYLVFTIFPGMFPGGDFGA